MRVGAPRRSVRAPRLDGAHRRAEADGTRGDRDHCRLPTLQDRARRRPPEGRRAQRHDRRQAAGGARLKNGELLLLDEPGDVGARRDRHRHQHRRASSLARSQAIQRRPRGRRGNPDALSSAWCPRDRDAVRPLRSVVGAVDSRADARRSVPEVRRARRAVSIEVLNWTTTSTSRRRVVRSANTSRTRGSAKSRAATARTDARTTTRIGRANATAIDRRGSRAVASTFATSRRVGPDLDRLARPPNPRNHARRRDEFLHLRARRLVERRARARRPGSNRCRVVRVLRARRGMASHVEKKRAASRWRIELNSRGSG